MSKSRSKTFRSIPHLSLCVCIRRVHIKIDVGLRNNKYDLKTKSKFVYISEKFSEQKFICLVVYFRSLFISHLCMCYWSNKQM